MWCDFSVQQRYVLTALLFTGMLFAYLERSCLSMAITQMVKPIDDVVIKTDETVCPARETESPATNTSIIAVSTESTGTVAGKYEWSSKEQGVILGSFYIGYIFTHAPSTYLMQIFGAKCVFGISILLSGLLSMTIPIAVQHYEAIGLIVVRIFMGGSQGLMLPAVMQLLSAWIPTIERSFITTIVMSGTSMGSVASTYLSGLILFYTNGDWRSLFYIFGSIVILWFIAYYFLCTNDPASHPRLSEKERNYLEIELKQMKQDENQAPTPWKEIFRSKPAMALVLTYILADWSYFVVFTTLPKYMYEVIHIDIRETGLFVSLPWILRTFLAYAVSIIIDKIIAAKCVSVTAARKWSLSLSSLVSAVFIVAASYAGCDRLLMVVFFILAVGGRALLLPSLYCNPMDLSPNYAGAITSVANGLGAFIGFLVPYIIGVLTPNALLNEWRLVFWITGIIDFLKMIIFLLWASGNVQPWNDTRIVKKV